MKSSLPRIAATAVLFPESITSILCPLHTRLNSNSVAVRMIHNNPSKKTMKSLSPSSLPPPSSTTSESCWIGRPFEASSCFRNNDIRDETLLNSAVPADIPLYKCNPMDLYLEKKQMYSDLFKQRITNPDDLNRIESRTIYHNIDNDDNSTSSAEKQHAVDVTIFWPTPPSEQQQQKDNKNDKAIKGICLHCHGGGWLWGDSKHQAASRLLNLSSKLNIAVVSVEYRMGPTNRHPAAVEDVETVASWLLQYREELVGSPSSSLSCPLIASGESAGAHLLTLAMLRLLKRKKNKHSQPQIDHDFFKCLNLVYGVYDLSGTPSVLTDGDQSAPISGKELQWLCDLYLPLEEGKGGDTVETTTTTTIINKKSPDISPLYADLKGMPPALFTVGTADPLLDDTLFMAARYGAAGCKAELAIYNGGQHGVGHFGLQENISLGREAREKTEDFLRQFLD